MEQRRFNCKPLCKRPKQNTKIKCISYDSSTHLTCYANDYGYENWVKKTIKIFYEMKDLIILISASGNSKNMIKACSIL